MVPSFRRTPAWFTGQSTLTDTLTFTALDLSVGIRFRRLLALLPVVADAIIFAALTSVRSFIFIICLLAFRLLCYALP